MFHIHFPFDKGGNGHPRDIQGMACPFLSFHSDAARLCNLFAILHHNPLRCDGHQPPDVCPLLRDNSVVVSFRDPSKLKVEP